jgi:hypothetical protein
MSKADSIRMFPLPCYHGSDDPGILFQWIHAGGSMHATWPVLSHVPGTYNLGHAYAIRGYARCLQAWMAAGGDIHARTVCNASIGHLGSHRCIQLWMRAGGSMATLAERFQQAPRHNTDAKGMDIASAYMIYTMPRHYHLMRMHMMSRGHDIDTIDAVMTRYMIRSERNAETIVHAVMASGVSKEAVASIGEEAILWNMPHLLDAWCSHGCHRRDAYEKDGDFTRVMEDVHRALGRSSSVRCLDTWLRHAGRMTIDAFMIHMIFLMTHARKSKMIRVIRWFQDHGFHVAPSVINSHLLWYVSQSPRLFAYINAYRPRNEPYMLSTDPSIPKSITQGLRHTHQDYKTLSVIPHTPIITALHGWCLRSLREWMLATDGLFEGPPGSPGYEQWISVVTHMCINTCNRWINYFKHCSMWSDEASIYLNTSSSRHLVKALEFLMRLRSHTDACCDTRISVILDTYAQTPQYTTHPSCIKTGVWLLVLKTMAVHGCPLPCWKTMDDRTWSLLRTMISPNDQRPCAVVHRAWIGHRLGQPWDETALRKALIHPHAYRVMLSMISSLDDPFDVMNDIQWIGTHCVTPENPVIPDLIANS